MLLFILMILITYILSYFIAKNTEYKYLQLKNYILRRIYSVPKALTAKG